VVEERTQLRCPPVGLSIKLDDDGGNDEVRQARWGALVLVEVGLMWGGGVDGVVCVDSSCGSLTR
jgi:hypothetical protein